MTLEKKFKIGKFFFKFFYIVGHDVKEFFSILKENIFRKLLFAGVTY